VLENWVRWFWFFATTVRCRRLVFPQVQVMKHLDSWAVTFDLWICIFYCPLHPQINVFLVLSWIFWEIRSTYKASHHVVEKWFKELYEPVQYNI
jgi:hypothetical protein